MLGHIVRPLATSLVLFVHLTVDRLKVFRRLDDSGSFVQSVF